MPKIIERESVLDGNAEVVRFDHRPSCFLRVYKPETRSYRTMVLNTNVIGEAKKLALSSYLELENKTHKRARRKTDLIRKIDEFLTLQKVRCIHGEISQRTLDAKRQRFEQRIIPYLKSVKITHVEMITSKSFSDFAGFYRSVSTKGKWNTETNGLSSVTINSDISTLKEFLKWLVEESLLIDINCPDVKKLKERKNFKEDSNPAFYPEEWDQFKKIIYSSEKKEGDPQEIWSSSWMIHWILFQYHSGCRPGETRLIRRCDCEIERMDDGKVKGIVKIPVNTKTGRRFMIMNGYTLQRVLSHLEKGAKLAGIEITPDDFLMLNPFSSDRTPYRDESIRKKFNQILQKANFEKRYTLYSLRSTHISHALLQPGAGSDIYKIAKNCGTSYQMIEQTYDGLSNLVNKGDLGFFQSRKKEDVLMN